MFSNNLGTDIALLALAWIGYLGLHSVLASLRAKAWVATHWPRLAARYRLGYNLIALGLLVPLLAVTLSLPSPVLWRWEGVWAWVAHVAAVIALAGIVWSSQAYDLQVFLGFRSATDRFGLSTPHRFVRHPWYFFGLLWLWTRDMDTARLAAVLPITLYIWIGAQLEDRKLEQELGDAYRRYRALVPGLLPRPWRYLSRTEAEQMSVSARRPAPR